jgi:hypothetical protein
MIGSTRFIVVDRCLDGHVNPSKARRFYWLGGAEKGPKEGKVMQCAILPGVLSLAQQL